VLARGPHLRRALDELSTLQPDAWERRLVAVLLRWRREAPATSTHRTPEEEETMSALADLNAWYEQYRTELINEGRNEGQFAVLARLFERKLARALSADERSVLRTRLLAQGHDALSDLVIERDADALAVWLASPDAPAS
jgi:hypothetical protein